MLSTLVILSVGLLGVVTANSNAAGAGAGVVQVRRALLLDVLTVQIAEKLEAALAANHAAGPPSPAALAGQVQAGPPVRAALAGQDQAGPPARAPLAGKKGAPPAPPAHDQKKALAAAAKGAAGLPRSR